MRGSPPLHVRWAALVLFCALALPSAALSLTLRVCAGRSCAGKRGAAAKKGAFVDVAAAVAALGREDLCVSSSMQSSASASGCLGGCDRGPNALAVDESGEAVFLDGMCAATGRATLYGLDSAARIDGVISKAVQWLDAS
mmetsp:Transcript_20233/g.69717  ORF Transcript_20233/g.69717 Transcript_20233/m.69717 type:complete len:140 (-) Transcript_20233:42-461(-)